ncbi:MAG: SUMF1/EgtB/PvdO family nonheme iron enzyme [Anaerolineae bacterium]|nr:SUMF1/EgtB/PvdO family nonheme iron enzyme [Anaerolineae bacterium]
MSRVFISYSSTDREFVKHIADDLRKQDFDIWMDTSDITGQLPYWEEIQNAVEACKHFIFVVSPTSITRESGAMKEVYHAVRHNKIVVPIIVRETNYDSIPMVVGPGMLQIHDFTKLPYDEALTRVIRALKTNTPTLPKDISRASTNRPARGRTAAAILIGTALIIAVGVIGMLIANNNNSNQFAGTVIAYNTPNETVAAFNFQTQTAAAWTDTPTVIVTATLLPTLDATNAAAWTPITRTVDYDGYKVEMAYVPAGTFMMGDDNSNQADERPAHKVEIAQPFWVDRTEVTNEQFAKLGGKADQTSTFTDPRQPRETITWIEAEAFCREKRGGALPTEEQWEWIAGGPQELIYPWGENWDTDRLIWLAGDRKSTANVGSKLTGASWVGALDMSGNVWEWTSTIYYKYDLPGEREDPTDTTKERVIRGGSWAYGIDVAQRTVFRTANRNLRAPNIRQNDLGFRCVMPIDSAP